MMYDFVWRNCNIIFKVKQFWQVFSITHKLCVIIIANIVFSLLQYRWILWIDETHEWNERTIKKQHPNLFSTLDHVCCGRLWRNQKKILKTDELLTWFPHANYYYYYCVFFFNVIPLHVTYWRNAWVKITNEKKTTFKKMFTKKTRKKTRKKQ